MLETNAGGRGEKEGSWEGAYLCRRVVAGERRGLPGIGKWERIFSEAGSRCGLASGGKASLLDMREPRDSARGHVVGPMCQRGSTLRMEATMQVLNECFYSGKFRVLDPWGKWYFMYCP